MPLHVALDTSFAGINLTGVGKYSRMLAAGLSDAEREGRLTVRCFGPSCHPNRAKLPLGGLYQEWPTYTQLFVPAALTLAKQKVHVVHSTSHLGPLWGPGRHIVTVHDVIFKRYPADYNSSWLKITETLLPMVLRRAAAILADSYTTKRDLERFYPVSRGKISVVYPGIDEAFQAEIAGEAVRAVRNKYGLGSKPYVLCLGPWVRRKNLKVVIQAFGMVAERLPEVRLVITGKKPLGMETGDASEDLGSLSPDTASRVKAVGHVDLYELPALVKGASVLTYPSLFEGFGLPPLEAMAAGVPVIASDTPAVAEAAGDAAILASPGDVARWRDALLSVLQNSEEAERLRKAGLERSSLFSWKRCVEETIAVYYQVAKGARGTR
jgi:alpha-1,3-rhamnosyl/mannosyltransferase